MSRRRSDDAGPVERWPCGGPRAAGGGSGRRGCGCAGPVTPGTRDVVRFGEPPCSRAAPGRHPAGWPVPRGRHFVNPVWSWGAAVTAVIGMLERPGGGDRTAVVENVSAGVRGRSVRRLTNTV